MALFSLSFSLLSCLWLCFVWLEIRAIPRRSRYDVTSVCHAICCIRTDCHHMLLRTSSNGQFHENLYESHMSSWGWRDWNSAMRWHFVWLRDVTCECDWTEPVWLLLNCCWCIACRTDDSHVDWSCLLFLASCSVLHPSAGHRNRWRELCVEPELNIRPIAPIAAPWVGLHNAYIIRF